MVGTIAESRLCPETRALVESLLDGTSLAKAGQWPDWIRREPRWKHTRPWHYINVADDQSIEDATGGRRGDVLQALAWSEGEFRDAGLGRKRRATALRFFAHFVADVHQPLHIGHEIDRGGNTVKVSVAGKVTNLHALWDAQGLLRASGGSGSAGQVAAMQGLVAGFGAQDLQGSPLDWARESRGYLLYVYDIKRKNAELMLQPEASYLDGARTIVKRRLALAGLRLAQRLNAVGCRGGQPAGNAGMP